MKKAYSITALSILALSLCPIQAQANLVSTFDSGNEGWTAIDPTGDYTSSWQSSIGNPAGGLLGIETNAQGGDGYFTAPNNWLGNWSVYAGGTISYDLKVIDGTSYFSDPDIQIISGSSVVSWTANVNPVGKGWVHYEIALTSANFTGGTLATILPNVTGFKIRGEVINGPEKEGFDNVMVTAAIPEPETYALLLSGLGLLGAIARRRKQIQA
jgi:hypothetical protein